MIKFTETIQVALSANTAFEQLAHMAELARWNPNVETSRRTGGGRLEVG